jgi:hypothetical protein
MKFEKLGLHSHILPALRARAATEPQENDTFFDLQLENAQMATVFDCRKLPSAFVDDTGDAAYHEAEQTSQKIRLPFAACYFEFDDELGVLAEELQRSDPDEVSIQFHVYIGWGEDYFDEYGQSLGPGYGDFPNGIDDDPEGSRPPYFLEHVNCKHAGTEWIVNHGAKRLLGVLTLLNDRLLATEIRPDPAPRLNKARAKKGKTPLSSESRVLTINTGAVRRAISASKVRSHESPRLHWRRGHWRVLHRGSEFESKAWVRRCLVGDASRGAIRKDYRVIWTPPMLRESV